MSNITVRIVFEGLIALSPHYDGELANRMTALAVASGLAPQNSICLVEHMAMIEFPASSQNCTALPDTGCDWSGGKCICPLDRQEILLLPDASLGDPCDDGIGRDFALYYELVQSPPEWSERPLPHVNDFFPGFTFSKGNPAPSEGRRAHSDH